MSDALTEHDLETRRAIEAVILATTEPVPAQVLAQLVEVPTARVEELCAMLAAEYEREGRGFVLARVAGGYRFQTHPDAAPYVERFVIDGQHVRLSGPALETLAIVAYKQPISRAQLSAIRGVDVDATLRTLVARGYVDEVGHEQSPGRPALFGTTALFLERLGVDSLDDLPSLAGFVPDAHVVEALERGLHLPGDDPAPEETEAAEGSGRPDVAEGTSAVDGIDTTDAAVGVEYPALGGLPRGDAGDADPADLAADLLAGLDPDDDVPGP